MNLLQQTGGSLGRKNVGLTLDIQEATLLEHRKENGVLTSKLEMV